MEVDGVDDGCLRKHAVVSPRIALMLLPVLMTLSAIPQQGIRWRIQRRFLSSPEDDEKAKSKSKRSAQTRESREASLAERAARDAEFLETFDPHSDWLPS
jgi:hypothetical protein